MVAGDFVIFKKLGSRWDDFNGFFFTPWVPRIDLTHVIVKESLNDDDDGVAKDSEGPS